MPKPLTSEKRKAIEEAINQGLTIYKDIADFADVSVNTVYREMRRQRGQKYSADRSLKIWKENNCGRALNQQATHRLLFEQRISVLEKQVELLYTAIKELRYGN